MTTDLAGTEHDVTRGARIEWAWAAASTRGTAHARAGQPGQDAHAVATFRAANGADVFVAAVADGAGTARLGGEGARLACAFFVDAALVLRMDNPADRAWREFALRWLRRVRREIGQHAIRSGVAPRDYACTFLGTVVGTDAAGFVQIGDGVVVVAPASEPEEYRHVFWPDRGEYANETHFITEARVRRSLRVSAMADAVSEVALLTDGLQTLALDESTRIAFAPFYRGAFRPLRRSPSGRSDRLSSALAAYLESPAIQRRTDDDTTLVLASRMRA